MKKTSTKFDRNDSFIKRWISKLALIDDLDDQVIEIVQVTKDQEAEQRSRLLAVHRRQAELRELEHPHGAVHA